MTLRGRAEALVAREREANDRWWASLAGTSPAASRSDGWTLVDVVAHVAAWQRYAAERIARYARDGIDPGPPGDTDRFNEDARRAAGSWDDVCRDAADAVDRLLSLVAALPDEQLDADDGLIDFIVRVNGSEHYEEHPHRDFLT